MLSGHEKVTKGVFAKIFKKNSVGTETTKSTLSREGGEHVLRSPPTSLRAGRRRRPRRARRPRRRRLLRHRRGGRASLRRKGVLGPSPPAGQRPRKQRALLGGARSRLANRRWRPRWRRPPHSRHSDCGSRVAGETPVEKLDAVCGCGPCCVWRLQITENYRTIL